MSTNKTGWFIVQVQDDEKFGDSGEDFLVTANEEQSIAEAARELEHAILKRFKPWGPKILGRQLSVFFTISGNSPDPTSLGITLSQLVTFLRELRVPPTQTKPIKPDLFGLGTNKIKVSIYEVQRQETPGFSVVSFWHVSVSSNC